MDVKGVTLFEKSNQSSGKNEICVLASDDHDPTSYDFVDSILQLHTYEDDTKTAWMKWSSMDEIESSKECESSEIICNIEKRKENIKLKENRRDDSEEGRYTCKNKRQKEIEEDCPKGKKPRVSWSNEMHLKFIKAIELLGVEKAYPKKIVEVMNVPWLTREQVASHLQKYRLNAKRVEREHHDSMRGLTTTYDFNKQQLFSSLHSSPNDLHFSSGNSLFPRHQSQFQQVPGSLSSIISCFNDSGQSQTPLISNYTKNETYFDEFSPILSKNSQQNDQKGPMKILKVESSGNNRPSNGAIPSNFVGFRMDSDGKSLRFGGEGGVVVSIENKMVEREDDFFSFGNEDFLVDPNSTPGGGSLPPPPPPVAVDFVCQEESPLPTTVISEVDSFEGGIGEFDALLNVTGSTSPTPHMLWDEDFDVTIFRHYD